MLYAVAKSMYQDVVALHATNRMLDEDADLAQNLIGYLLCIAQLRVGVLFTLTRLLGTGSVCCRSICVLHLSHFLNQEDLMEREAMFQNP